MLFLTNKNGFAVMLFGKERQFEKYTSTHTRAVFQKYYYWQSFVRHKYSKFSEYRLLSSLNDRIVIKIKTKKKKLNYNEIIF